MSTTNAELRERIVEEIAALVHPECYLLSPGEDVLPGEHTEDGCMTCLVAADRILAALPSPGGERESPTPESMRAMAEWFDNPRESPPVAVVVGGVPYTAGMLLREFARQIEALTSETP